MNYADHMTETGHEREEQRPETFWRQQVYREKTIYASGRTYVSCIDRGGMPKTRAYVIGILGWVVGLSIFISPFVYFTNLGNRQAV